jgi:hypothetical protein
MFFSDTNTGAFFSEFQVGDLRPDPAPSAYCSAHMGMAVMGIQRDLLVNAWYTGGVDVIDFMNPTKLREIAYYDIAGPGPVGLRQLVRIPVPGAQVPEGTRGADLRLGRGPHPRLRQGSHGVSAPLRKAGADVRSPEPQTMD